MEPATIKLYLATNADLHDLQPIIDEADAPVDMSGWPFKLMLKGDENDSTVALEVTVTVNALGELLFAATKEAIAPQLTAPAKKRRLVGDLLTKPYNGTYVARLARVEAILERGVSTL